jgi:hypothetical protein
MKNGSFFLTFGLFKAFYMMKIRLRIASGRGYDAIFKLHTPSVKPTMPQPYIVTLSKAFSSQQNAIFMV